MAFQAVKLPVRAYFIVYSLTLFSCENDPEQVDAIFRKKTAVEEAYQVESYLSQGGKVRARLTAPYMKRYVVDSPYIEFSKTLHVDFFQDSQLIESTLDALFARHMEFQRKAWIRDSVVVINKWKGDTLRTNELWWDQNAEEFYTDKPVWIYQRTGYTYGKNGMRAKQDFSEWWILASSGSRQVSDTGFIQ